MLFVLAILLVVFGVIRGTWALLAVIAGVTIEVSQTLFWLWYTQRRSAQVGAETLLGRVVEVAAECRPVGLVRVQGELWQARCRTGAARGTWARVIGRDGLTLEVEPEPKPE